MPDSVHAHLHWLDATIIVAYLAGVVGIGLYHARRQRDLGEFFLAGRELRWLVLGLSLLAALNSGLDYLMQPSAMIQYGVAILAANLTWLVLLPYVFSVTLPLYRNLRSVSAYDYLERRFDLRVRTLAASIFILWRLGWMATALYVPSIVITATSGGAVSPSAVIIIIGTVITAFTMLGGIRAVIWNEVLQCVVMFLGLAATVALSLTQIDGGLSAILSQLHAVGDPAMRTAPAGAPDNWTDYFYVPMTAGGMFIAVLVARLTTYTCDQVMVQRFQTSKTDADARRGMVLTAVGDVVWMLALGFVGLTLFAFFRSRYGGLPAWASDHPDQMFPFFIAEAFPIGLTGLILAAIMAASISSIGCAMNSITSVVAVDFLQRLITDAPSVSATNSAADQRRQVATSRAINLAVGVVGTVAALQVSRLGGLLETSNKVINSFTGPLLGIYLLGMFTRRANSVGVLVGGAIGAAVTIYFAFTNEIQALIGDAVPAEGRGPVVSFLWPSSFGLATTIALGYLGSFVARNSAARNAEQWMWTGVVGPRSAK